jgi:hypothetical protein
MPTSLCLFLFSKDLQNISSQITNWNLFFIGSRGVIRVSQHFQFWGIKSKTFRVSGSGTKFNNFWPHGIITDAYLILLLVETENNSKGVDWRDYLTLTCLCFLMVIDVVYIWI